MPLLGRRSSVRTALALAPPSSSHAEDAWRFSEPHSGQRSRSAFLETCANPGCRSGWLHLWRQRTAPFFEEGWTCSPLCTEARIAAAVSRELSGREMARPVHRHRVPIGLLLLEQGWITQAQLKRALEAQKAAGSGRVGQWLMGQSALDEDRLTRALGLQWSCPVLSLEHFDPAALTGVMPRLFIDAYGALPLRVAAGRLLYLGFEEALDPVLALALERMTGLRVESGVVRSSQFRNAHARMLDARFPSVELIEAVSEPAAAHALARSVERARPGAARLVRIHDCLWLRMWERPGSDGQPGAGWARDLVCSIGL
ncbi:MAG TPA: hypothetical protein VG893_15440 [Terracidiphilus sp.]|nr:hypothetical protein [Terracidiphilus sp.]